VRIDARNGSIEPVRNPDRLRAGRDRVWPVADVDGLRRNGAHCVDPRDAA
jgi:hypothetical protein